MHDITLLSPPPFLLPPILGPPVPPFLLNPPLPSPPLYPGIGGGAAMGGADLGSGGGVALPSCLLFVCAGLEGPQQQELC